MRARTFFVGAAAGALGLAAVPSQAQTYDYTFSGTATGTLVLDFNGTAYSLDSLNLTVDGATFTQADSSFTLFGAPFYILGGNLNGVNTVISGTNDFYVTLNPALSTQTTGITYSNVSSNTVPNGPVTITRLEGAVPEPAAWAMMLLGFAAIGIAVRFARIRPHERCSA